MIYVHVPFCHRKCAYCAFYSQPLSSRYLTSDFRLPTSDLRLPTSDLRLPTSDLRLNYVEALLREMEERKGEQSHPIKTVYFGGGTPSILPIDQLARVVEGLHRCFDLSQVEETTIECNPEDLSPDYLNSLRQLGFNRLSIGIQSLDDKVLRMLNRRHTAQQALEAVKNAHAAGFNNISVDFIYGLPEVGGQGPEAGVFTSDFQLLISDLISHVSAYALTVEPGTALAVQVEQGRVALPDEDEVVRQYHALHRQLTDAGFRQYEVSNYARPGCESKHNSRYWDRTPYLGLGPGAHSFDGLHRRWNINDIGVYCEALKDPKDHKNLFQEETLTATDAYTELLMTALRTVRGLPVSAVPEKEKKKLQPYLDCSWLVLQDGFYRPTTEGLLHADGMAADLFV